MTQQFHSYVFTHEKVKCVSTQRSGHEYSWLCVVHDGQEKERSCHLIVALLGWTMLDVFLLPWSLHFALTTYLCYHLRCFSFLVLGSTYRKKVAPALLLCTIGG